MTSGVTSIDRIGNIVLRISFLLLELMNWLIIANVLGISELVNTSKCFALSCQQLHEARRLPFAISNVYFCSTDRLASYTEHLGMSFNFLMPSGHYTYHQFNIQQSYILPTQCTYVFCVDLRTKSNYFPLQH